MTIFSVLVHLQNSPALSMTERDAITYLWEFIAWMLAAIGAGCMALVGVLWRWLVSKFKQMDATETRLRASFQGMISPLDTKVTAVGSEVQMLREALCRLHPTIDLDR